MISEYIHFHPFYQGFAVYKAETLQNVLLPSTCSDFVWAFFQSVKEYASLTPLLPPKNSESSRPCQYIVLAVIAVGGFSNKRGCSDREEREVGGVVWILGGLGTKRKEAFTTCTKNKVWRAGHVCYSTTDNHSLD